MTFDVSLSAPAGQTVTVTWATADGTATAPDDAQGYALLKRLGMPFRD